MLLCQLRTPERGVSAASRRDAARWSRRACPACFIGVGAGTTAGRGVECWLLDVRRFSPVSGFRFPGSPNPSLRPLRLRRDLAPRMRLCGELLCRLPFGLCRSFRTPHSALRTNSRCVLTEMPKEAKTGRRRKNFPSVSPLPARTYHPLLPPPPIFDLTFPDSVVDYR